VTAPPSGAMRSSIKRGANRARVVGNRTDGPVLVAVGSACWVHDLPTSTAPPSLLE
jgi:hypothetical protein